MSVLVERSGFDTRTRDSLKGQWTASRMFSGLIDESMNIRLPHQSSLFTIASLHVCDFVLLGPVENSRDTLALRPLRHHVSVEIAASSQAFLKNGEQGCYSELVRSVLTRSQDLAEQPSDIFIVGRRRANTRAPNKDCMDIKTR